MAGSWISTCFKNCKRYSYKIVLVDKALALGLVIRPVWTHLTKWADYAAGLNCVSKAVMSISKTRACSRPSLMPLAGHLLPLGRAALRAAVGTLLPPRIRKTSSPVSNENTTCQTRDRAELCSAPGPRPLAGLTQSGLLGRGSPPECWEPAFLKRNGSRVHASGQTYAAAPIIAVHHCFVVPHKGALVTSIPQSNVGQLSQRHLPAHPRMPRRCLSERHQHPWHGPARSSRSEGGPASACRWRADRGSERRR
ncbi:hypothetical protein TRM7615_03686 [Falsiruegeria mediterranea M17]|uniref:Uncharacterized protein n=1 Tax=Falsiruegeria mediterranea M17 TaxID=1200281 RepID=A0A2R8CCJ1_9RHOB|nr:hypothetical protein TRM7615_03686 [Falsiruegeria mediterranea M17]